MKMEEIELITCKVEGLLGVPVPYVLSVPSFVGNFAAEIMF